MSYFSQNTNSFNTTNVDCTLVTSTDGKAEVLSWLSPLEPHKRHQDVRTRRCDGIGDWLLETAEFKRWRDGHDGSPILYVSGAPGAGKTYLSSLVVDTICNQNREQHVGVACLYADFLEQEDRSATSMIGAILKQLVIALPEIPKEIHRDFLSSTEHLGGRGLCLPELIQMFQVVLPSFQRTYICIDALDEIHVAKRPELLKSLAQIMQNSPETRLFITGRPHIREELERHLMRSVNCIFFQPSQRDIKKYLASRLQADPEPGSMDEQLRLEIMTKIPEEFSDIFLLVFLHIEAILGETTITRRRRKLNQMAHGLTGTYKSTLERIKQQPGDRSRLGMAVLTWVCLAVRPLHVDELCHAVAVESGTADLDINNIPTIQLLLGCCLGLVVVDERTSTVRPVHFTVKEYLISQGDLFLNAHSMLAEVCLTYLNYRCVNELPSNTLTTPATLPFLRYASCYWGIHVGEQATPAVKALSLALLSQYPNHISACVYLLEGGDRIGCVVNKMVPPPRALITRGFTGLHYVASLGISELVNDLVRTKPGDIGTTDSFGCTPLLWAVMNGQVKVVKQLLEGQDSGTRSGATREERLPILSSTRIWCRRNWNLIWGSKRANPNVRDTRWGRTPLSWAVDRGHKEIVEMLLNQRDVNPNLRDFTTATPLSWAAHEGKEETVRMLLERADVNPDEIDSVGRSPLFWAAKNGHVEVVRLLLEQNGINPNRTDVLYGRTALSRAAEKGNVGVVKLLLERKDVNQGLADNRGRTPLSWAARNGHEQIVKLLERRQREVLV